ncbi:MAG TPA: response regulator transcription factor [Chthoniobacterales bacterium]|jgi:DNA-binding NarL/FixJ family response regulator|nr:response regulator transcription factor [Chthoniobacterales bacterium]
MRRRILLVDDHPVVRQGLAQLINQKPDLLVCGEAANIDEGLAAAGALKPDLVVVDLSLGGEDGAQLIEQLKFQFPGLPVLVFSMHDERVAAQRALRAGAQGYVMKQDALSHFFLAVKQILEGEIYLSDEMRRRLFPLRPFAG